MNFSVSHPHFYIHPILPSKHIETNQGKEDGANAVQKKFLKNHCCLQLVRITHCHLAFATEGGGCHGTLVQATWGSCGAEAWYRDVQTLHRGIVQKASVSHDEQNTILFAIVSQGNIMHLHLQSPGRM